MNTTIGLVLASHCASVTICILFVKKLRKRGMQEGKALLYSSGFAVIGVCSAFAITLIIHRLIYRFEGYELLVMIFAAPVCIYIAGKSLLYQTKRRL